MGKAQIMGKIDREMLKLLDCKRMLKGTVSKVVVKSGKAKRRDKIIWQLTYKKDENVTRTIYVREEKLSEAKKRIRNYQKAKSTLNRLLDLNVELFKFESKKDLSS